MKHLKEYVRVDGMVCSGVVITMPFHEESEKFMDEWFGVKPSITVKKRIERELFILWLNQYKLLKINEMKTKMKVLKKRLLRLIEAAIREDESIHYT